MWLCAVLALAALNEAEALREVRPFNVNPSAISNLELLIPVAMLERPEHTEHRIESQRAYAKPAYPDGPFSAIPGYAFSLDTEPYKYARPLPSPFPKAEVPRDRSLYLAQFWERPKGEYQDKEQDNARNVVSREKKEDACRTLSAQYAGEAREVLLYLCNEIVDVLKARCDCCEADRFPRVSHGSGPDRPSPVMPWFGPIGARREWVPLGGNSAVLENYVNMRARPRPRVFV